METVDPHCTAPEFVLLEIMSAPQPNSERGSGGEVHDIRPQLGMLPNGNVRQRIGFGGDSNAGRTHRTGGHADPPLRSTRYSKWEDQDVADGTGVAVGAKVLVGVWHAFGLACFLSLSRLKA